jgi:hypothetical protein
LNSSSQFSGFNNSNNSNGPSHGFTCNRPIGGDLGTGDQLPVTEASAVLLVGATGKSTSGNVLAQVACVGELSPARLLEGAAACGGACHGRLGIVDHQASMAERADPIALEDQDRMVSVAAFHLGNDRGATDLVLDQPEDMQVCSTHAGVDHQPRVAHHPDTDACSAVSYSVSAVAKWFGAVWSWCRQHVPAMVSITPEDQGRTASMARVDLSPSCNDQVVEVATDTASEDLDRAEDTQVCSNHSSFCVCIVVW